MPDVRPTARRLRPTWTRSSSAASRAISGLGPDRPAALAQGVQPRLQVRRPARRGRGPDAGHLPQDLQGAAHVRPARELSDLAHQHQPQPVHRPLPQRAQGARDDGARRGRVRAVAGVARARARYGQLEQIDLQAAAFGRRWPNCRRRCARRSCCATCRNSRIRKSPTSSDLPEGTVKSRINRGRLELARQLRRLQTQCGRPTSRPAPGGTE